MVRQKNCALIKKLREYKCGGILWIGCIDDQIKEHYLSDKIHNRVYMYKNVASQVIHTDLNLASVVRYAIEKLRVVTIIVSGHYGCSVLKEIVGMEKNEVLDNWLFQLKNIYTRTLIPSSRNESNRSRLEWLGEVNIIEQVYNLGNSLCLRESWLKGKKIAIHGMMFDENKEEFVDLEVSFSNELEFDTIYQTR
jgi:carbonic anhydrase